MNTATARSQKEVVLNALSNGRELSPNQLLNQYRIPGYRTVIRRLRRDGYAIYTNRNAGGTTYRLGTPTRAMVGLAARLFGARLFGT